ncbi:MAG: glutamate-5-semialdehyde dehydrogenase, partial [Ancrocorticia sp.]
MAGLTPTEGVEAAARRAQQAARALRGATSGAKDALLRTIADELEAHSDAIVAANVRDIEAGRASGMAEGLIDRLLLTPER